MKVDINHSMPDDLFLELLRFTISFNLIGLNYSFGYFAVFLYLYRLGLGNDWLYLKTTVIESDSDCY